MEVLGGALMASMDQTGLRPDLPKLQAQIVAQLLTTVLNTMQTLVSQLGQMMGLPGAGGAAGNAGNAGNAGGAAGNAGNAGNAGGAAGNAGNAGNAGGAAGNAGNAGNAGGGVKPGGGGYGGTTPGGGYGTTPGTTPGTPTDPTRPAGGVIDPNLRYQDLNNAQRTQMSGMDDRQRGVLHLWGIQMGAAGHQDGGVLLNVLNNPQNFKPAEVELAKELAAKEQAEFGGITGKSLDREFFGLYQNLTGKDISQRYGNAPVRFAQGPVNMENRATGQNGLNQFENEVMQLWGHSPLFTGGKIDGSILQYAMNSNNRMETNLNQGDVKALFDADLASDGVLNGDSLENAMLDVMDRVYLGGPAASANKTMNDAMEEAAQRRQGLLPPPTRQAADLSRPVGPQANQGTQAGSQAEQVAAQAQGKKTGGACPFGFA
jgi:hypothetical protein